RGFAGRLVSVSPARRTRQSYGAGLRSKMVGLDGRVTTGLPSQIDQEDDTRGGARSGSRR
ncbi:hypothetical protein A2U01_0102333, partial [Trifolium medium]|nr:hypothetical protein [Trifolium medium]